MQGDQMKNSKSERKIRKSEKEQKIFPSKPENGFESGRWANVFRPIYNIFPGSVWLIGK